MEAAAIATDPVERLKQIVGSVLSTLGEKGELLAVFMERGAVGEYDFQNLLMGASHARDYEEFLELLEKTLRDGIRQKRLRGDVDAQACSCRLFRAPSTAPSTHGSKEAVAAGSRRSPTSSFASSYRSTMHQ